MRFASIASGSSGNCLYASSDTTHILIDAGISGKKVEAGLLELGVMPANLNAILITHEHSDHIQGLGVLSRKYHIPIYATNGTAAGIKNMTSLGKIDSDLINIVKADTDFFINDIEVKPIRISHDANEPVAYRIVAEGKKLSIITDLGVYDDYTVDCLRNSNILFAEANHDIRMLEAGPYPYPLKKRILSDRGHLSNEASGRMISALLHDDLKAIYLGHLSKENNMPELAYETVRLEIEASQTKYSGNDFPIIVAKRDVPTEAIEI